MTKSIEITRAEFAAQLQEICTSSPWKQLARESLAVWDEVIGDKDRVTLYIRGYDPYYRYHKAATKAEGFYGCDFPICERLAA